MIPTSLLSHQLAHQLFAQLFAHEGGWDEALLVLVPLITIAILLWFANRRLKSRLRELGDAPDGSSDLSDPARDI